MYLIFRHNLISKDLEKAADEGRLECLVLVLNIKAFPTKAH